MSKRAKKKAEDEKIHVRPFVDKQGYPGFLVQGWKENGKWQRKQFNDENKANNFADELRLKAKNKGAEQRLLLSTLDDKTQAEAEAAIAQLGKTYSLADAVAYFLKHHRPPEYTIRLADAIKLYLDDKERDGLRPRTLHGIGWTLGLFSTATDNPLVHEVTSAQVEAYLRGLRAKNGKDRATLRSWEIHRGALSGFFGWCAMKDAGSNRPFTFDNPVEQVRKFSARLVREEQTVTPATTLPADVLRIFSTLMRWRGGVLVRPFAFLYFLGVRPDELKRMNGRERELVNLKTLTVTIPANVSKTRQQRTITIPDNLAAWLKAFPGDLIPTNFEALNKKVRKHFELSHDEQRHSFISYHVALHRSVGDAALQAGNSEAIVKRHYLNTHTQKEGGEFFRIEPDVKRRRAVLAKPVPVKKSHLKVV